VVGRAALRRATRGAAQLQRCAARRAGRRGARARSGPNLGQEGRARRVTGEAADGRLMRWRWPPGVEAPCSWSSRGSSRGEPALGAGGPDLGPAIAPSWVGRRCSISGRVGCGSSAGSASGCWVMLEVDLNSLARHDKVDLSSVAPTDGSCCSVSMDCGVMIGMGEILRGCGRRRRPRAPSPS
jgi:hypothetical protein